MSPPLRTSRICGPPPPAETRKNPLCIPSAEGIFTAEAPEIPPHRRIPSCISLSDAAGDAERFPGPLRCPPPFPHAKSPADRRAPALLYCFSAMIRFLPCCHPSSSLLPCFCFEISFFHPPRKKDRFLCPLSDRVTTCYGRYMGYCFPARPCRHKGRTARIFRREETGTPRRMREISRRYSGRLTAFSRRPGTPP